VTYFLVNKLAVNCTLLTNQPRISELESLNKKFVARLLMVTMRLFDEHSSLPNYLYQGSSIDVQDALYSAKLPFTR
jgi:hypothetical protein